MKYSVSGILMRNSGHIITNKHVPTSLELGALTVVF